MSCHPHKHEALSPYTREPGSGGPTGTFSHQKRFAQRLRGVLARINARIREAFQNGLLSQETEALVDDPPEEIFQTNSDRRAIAGFLAWLRDQFDNNYLRVVGPDRNQFLRAAYAQGIRLSQRDLSDFDIAFTRPDVDDILSRPIHRSSLQTLYTRTYENLESVRDETVDAVRDTLIQGFREGTNPRQIGRDITDRVDSIGKHRSTLIARSEVINAYTEGYLNRTEEVGKDTSVQIGVEHQEWMTADDDRVCPICNALDGKIFSLSEMRNGTFALGGTTFRLRPPAHPNCRCALSIVVGYDATDKPPLSERLPTESEINAQSNR